MMDSIHDYLPVAVAVVSFLGGVTFTWFYAKSEGRLEGRAEVHREMRHAKEVRL